MFITKKKLERKLVEAKDAVYRDTERTAWERERNDRINKALADINKRLTALEKEKAQKRSGETVCAENPYWV